MYGRTTERPYRLTVYTGHWSSPTVSTRVSHVPAFFPGTSEGQANDSSGSRPPRRDLQ